MLVHFTTGCNRSSFCNIFTDLQFRNRTTHESGDIDQLSATLQTVAGTTYHLLRALLDILPCHLYQDNPHENSTIKKAITCSSLSSRYWFELRNSPSSLSPSFASLSCSLARRSRLNTCKVHFIKLSGFAWSPPCRPPSPNCQQALPSPPRV